MSYKRIKLVEFELPNFNENMDIAWCYLRGIHKSVLSKDKYWHFFYEDYYSVIRCSKKYMDDLIQYFEDNTIDYLYKGQWEDGSEYVERYKKQFIPIFHNYSMLSLSLDEHDLVNVSDRICHSFFNHCTYPAKTYREYYGKHSWEARVMGDLAVSRAEYIGKLKLSLKLKKEKEMTVLNEEN